MKEHFNGKKKNEKNIIKYCFCCKNDVIENNNL